MWGPFSPYGCIFLYVESTVSPNEGILHHVRAFYSYVGPFGAFRGLHPSQHPYTNFYGRPCLHLHVAYIGLA